MKKDVMRVAVIALAAVAVAALVQSKVQIPLIGPYLPGGAKV
jgi:hypothetical protein